MTEKRWTILVMERGAAPVRQFGLSERGLKLWGGAALLCAIVLIGAAATVGFGGTARVEAERLALTNATLTSELGEIRSRVNDLEEYLAMLSDQDAHFRTLAGLDSIDEEVLQVGVGGPGSPTLEAHPVWALDPEAGKEAFAVAYDLNVLERRARLLVESLTEASDSISAHRELMEATPSILPTAGRLSSGFTNARLHPIHHRMLPHEGIDVAAPRGTPILAAAKGRVTFAGRRAGYGLMVEIDHGYGHSTIYGHAQTLLVQRGQEVTRGEVIAQVGNTGIATAPHLHYEVRVNGRPVNPMNYVISGAIP
jgi:murein DD-endopeptidase MepM/ murein hydrolase activator NlpD